MQELLAHTVCPSGFPLNTLLSDTRDESEVSRLLWRQSGGFLWVGATGALGFCRIQMMGRGYVPAKGPVGAWDNPSPPDQTPELLWKCKESGKGVSKSCSVNPISARLKDS